MKKFVIVFLGLLSAGFIWAESMTKEAAVDYLVTNYPKAQLADLYKSFYQDAFGPGHILGDTVASRRYFFSELADTSSWSGPAYEYTGSGNNFVRLNMDLVKKGVIPAEAFFQAFVNSLGQVEPPKDEDWIMEWQSIDKIIKNKGYTFSNEGEDRALIDKKMDSHEFTMHHSPAFNSNYNFHYRIISLPQFEILKSTYDIESSPVFWLGADISGTPEQEARGIVNYNSEKEPMENTALMRYFGLNAIRLKVWVNSENGFNTPRHVLEMARRAQYQGMEIMIDFHYSDTWADPGHNNSPKEWLGEDLIVVKGKLVEHTKSTLQLLKDNGIKVKWVQVGNETTNGMVWPIARIPDHMEAYVELSNAGYDAVKQVYPEAIVITHLDDGYNRFLYEYVFNAMNRLGGKYDAIGMSVYPYWSKRDQTTKEAVEDIIDNINYLSKEFKCPVYIVETGAEVWKPEEGYDFISRLIQGAMNDTHGNCPGVFYWEPTAVHTPEKGGYSLGAYESFMPTKIMDAFKEASTKK